MVFPNGRPAPVSLNPRGQRRLQGLSMTAENRELSLLRDRIAELERELARLRVDPLAPSPKPVHADPESPSPRLAIDRRLSREQELARITRITTLGEMTAGLAHDLNQPLSSIQSLAFACQQRLSGERSGDEALSENLEEIRNQADRARRIIQRVRLFIRNAAPRRVENPINQLVDEAIRLSESD
ncbi:MAG: hypothetical protein KC729_15960, partial [Candidatus Eisenbacteria bacterium]|nr:hypothetical protein [Candidatus Eisenbacteria bacterium]